MNASATYAMCGEGSFPHYYNKLSDWYYVEGGIFSLTERRISVGPGFHILDDSGWTPCGNRSHYAMDDQYAYYDGRIISEAESSSFTLINSRIFLGKDNFHVFYQDQESPKANPNGKIKEVQIGTDYWTDDDDVFYKSKHIATASAKSFRLSQSGWMGQDEKHYYFQENVFEKKDCPSLGEHIFQCGQKQYQVFSGDSEIRELTEIDSSSFHYLGRWKNDSCAMNINGKEADLYQDKNGIYLTGQDFGRGLDQFVNLKPPRRFSSLDPEIMGLICSEPYHRHLPTG